MSIDATRIEGELDIRLEAPGALGRSHAIPIVRPSAAAVNGKVKVIVAVHGIGDQSSAGTVSSVATRFYRYMDKPAAIPLGRFHGGDKGEVSVAYFPMNVFPEAYGFAEIYWASVPREVVKEGYT